MKLLFLVLPIVFSISACSPANEPDGGPVYVGTHSNNQNPDSSNQGKNTADIKPKNAAENLLHVPIGRCDNRTLRFNYLTMTLTIKGHLATDFMNVDIFMNEDGTYQSIWTQKIGLFCPQGWACDEPSISSMTTKGSWRVIGEDQVELSNIGIGTLEGARKNRVTFKITGEELRLYTNAKTGDARTKTDTINFDGITADTFCKQHPGYTSETN